MCICMYIYIYIRVCARVEKHAYRWGRSTGIPIAGLEHS